MAENSGNRLRTHNERSVFFANREGIRLCAGGCGERCRPYTFFCGDACRFWSKVQKGPGCWPWTASRTKAGYGQFTITEDGKQRNIGAHVYAYILQNGPVPDGAWVLHACDFPPCVRGDHLFPGTHKTNMEDAATKGRLHVPRPNHQTLTVNDIALIRQRVWAGERRYRVAADFGISKAYVTRIMAGSARQYDAPLPQSIEKAS